MTTLHVRTYMSMLHTLTKLVHVLEWIMMSLIKPVTDYLLLLLPLLPPDGHVSGVKHGDDDEPLFCVLQKCPLELVGSDPRTYDQPPTHSPTD